MKMLSTVGKLRAVMSIRFVLKSRCVLEPFSSYRNLQSGRNGRNKERKNGTFARAHFYV